MPAALVAADRARSLVLAALRAAAAVRPPTSSSRCVPSSAGGSRRCATSSTAPSASRSSGGLLAPPGPPEIVAVRHWASGQVLAQLHGAAPTAWTGPVELPAASAARWAAGSRLADSA